jgi:uncharacterized protein YdeI (YjbR/CyaY-like superfamily)
MLSSEFWSRRRGGAVESSSSPITLSPQRPIAPSHVVVRRYSADEFHFRIEGRDEASRVVPEELKEKFRNDPRFKRAFDALTPGRQRGYLFHFAGAKQSRTRTARIEKAMPAIFEGRGFLERR